MTVLKPSEKLASLEQDLDTMSKPGVREKMQAEGKDFLLEFEILEDRIREAKAAVKAEANPGRKAA
jgi:hypothetical protein